MQGILYDLGDILLRCHRMKGKSWEVYELEDALIQLEYVITSKDSILSIGLQPVHSLFNGCEIADGNSFRRGYMFCLQTANARQIPGAISVERACRTRSLAPEELLIQSIRAIQRVL